MLTFTPRYISDLLWTWLKIDKPINLLIFEIILLGIRKYSKHFMIGQLSFCFRFDVTSWTSKLLNFFRREKKRNCAIYVSVHLTSAVRFTFHVLIALAQEVEYILDWRVYSEKSFKSRLMHDLHFSLEWKFWNVANKLHNVQFAKYSSRRNGFKRKTPSANRYYLAKLYNRDD